jgi:hypothetical protein
VDLDRCDRLARVQAVQRYLRAMAFHGSPSAALARALLLAAATAAFGAPYAAAAPAGPRVGGGLPPSPYHSHDLWATINVCNSKDAPDMVGIRGSMPGTGQADETMYMRFRLQYMDESTDTWQELGAGSDSGFVAVGSASTVRQTGRSFTLRPSTSPVTLRGVVAFQWRRGTRVIYATERATSANHVSLAGASPPGFSAATCQFT